MKKFLLITIAITSIVIVFVGCNSNTDSSKSQNNSVEISLEKSNEILSNSEWLPLGSVVSVDDSEQKVMIIGRLQQDRNNPNIKFEYSAVLYPQGLLNPAENFMFNKKQIKRVYFLGYSNDDNKLFEKKLDKYLNK